MAALKGIIKTVVVLGACALVVGAVVWYFKSGPSDISYSELLSDVSRGAVAEVSVSEDEARARYGDGRYVRTPVPASVIPDLVKQLTEHRVVIVAAAPSRFHWATVFGYSVPVLLGFGLLFAFARSMQSGSKVAGNFGKSPATLHEGGLKRVTFRDVAGIDKVKEQVAEVVDFLRAPQRFQKVGARPPRGILLVGEPGTGKTLLARAVAGEADVPFFSVSGADFVEMFVGVGAARVRDLFEQGRKNAPCIVFIDELDAVARHRGFGRGWGHDEREQTLNQLLVEMDGFAQNSGVVVMAATNRADILDSALLRPGRFDRRITVPLPDWRGRMEIFRVHLKDKPLDLDVEDFELLAQRTNGFSGADIMNIANEAAMSAARRQDKWVTLNDLESCIDKVVPSGALLDELDEVVEDSLVGQGRAKAAVAAVATLHYEYSRRVGAGNRPEGAKGCLLLLGPRGTGKTTLLKKTAEHLGVPFYSCPATRLAGGHNGYGHSPFQLLLRELYLAADSDMRRAQHGILCIEGLDRALRFGSNYSDVFQASLAALIRGAALDIPLKTVSFDSEVKRFHTGDLLFVLEASMPEVEQIINGRFKDRNYIPMTRLISEEPISLIQNGFSDELLEAISLVSTFAPLSASDLEMLLETPDGTAQLEGFQTVLNSRGAAVELAEEAPRIAKKAHGLGKAGASIAGLLHDVCVNVISKPAGQEQQALDEVLDVDEAGYVYKGHYVRVDPGAVVAELPPEIGAVTAQRLLQPRGTVILVERPDGARETTADAVVDWLRERAIPCFEAEAGSADAHARDLDRLRAETARPLELIGEVLEMAAGQPSNPRPARAVDIVVEAMESGNIDGLRTLVLLRGISVRLGHDVPPRAGSALSYLIQAHRSLRLLDVVKVGFELKEKTQDEMGRSTRATSAATYLSDGLADIEGYGMLADEDGIAGLEVEQENVKEALAVTPNLKRAVCDVVARLRENLGLKITELDGITARAEWSKCKPRLERRGDVRHTPNVMLLLAASDACVNALSVSTAREVRRMVDAVYAQVFGRADRRLERLQYWRTQVQGVRKLLSGEKTGECFLLWKHYDFDLERMCSELQLAYQGISLLNPARSFDVDSFSEALDRRYGSLQREAIALCEKYISDSTSENEKSVALLVDEFESEAIRQYCEEQRVSYITLTPASA